MLLFPLSFVCLFLIELWTAQRRILERSGTPSCCGSPRSWVSAPRSSGTLTVATTALLAIATWIGTVLLADQMRRRDHRGHLELLVRRITYRT